MPPLHLFGRSWHAAADDLPVYALLSIIVHGVWALLTMAGFIIAHTSARWIEQGCKESSKLLASAYLGVDLGLVLLWLALLVFSLRGSILDTEKRKPVGPIIYAITVFYVLVLAVNIGGSVRHAPHTACPNNHRMSELIRAIFLWHWIMFAVFVLVALISFDPFQALSDDMRYTARLWCFSWCSSSMQNMPEAHPGAAQDLGHVRDDAFKADSTPIPEMTLTPAQQIGALMQLLFSGVDLTTTDYAAGVLLVNNCQRMERLRGNETEPTSATLPDGTVLTVTVSALEDAEFYAPFAFSIYGAAANIRSLESMDKWGCQACGSVPDRGPTGVRFPISTTNMTIEVTIGAIRAMTHINPATDLLWINWSNELQGLLPYTICIARERRELIVSVRGSLSKNDWMTDLLCRPVEVEPEFYGGVLPSSPPQQVRSLHVQGEEGQMAGIGSLERDSNLAHDGRKYAHQGMLQCAKAIIADFRKHRVLEAVLMGDADAQEFLKHAIYRQDCREYTIVVTGHSLGAGVASLLALHLRSRFPTRAMVFAPPGGLMSPALAASMRGYCTSVIIGRDLVPRLSISNMASLAGQMVECCARCRVSKARLLLRPRKLWAHDQLFLAADAEISEEARLIVDKFRDEARNTDVRLAAFDGARDFVPPGLLLYYRVNDFEQPGVDMAFKPRLVDNQAFAAAGIIIGTHAMDMHMPSMHMRAIRQAVDSAHRRQFSSVHVPSLRQPSSPVALPAARPGQHADAECGQVKVELEAPGVAPSG